MLQLQHRSQETATAVNVDASKVGVGHSCMPAMYQDRNGALPSDRAFRMDGETGPCAHRITTVTGR